MRLFAPKPPVSTEELDWLLACFAWLRQVLRDGDIRPTAAVPSSKVLDDPRTAQALFNSVKSLAGMDDWPCKLQKVKTFSEPSDVQEIIDSVAACGTFSVENGVAIIRYSDAMLRDPAGLTATFAHELCHYLLINAGDPPGGTDLMEHSTDCAAAYLGFGVFLANSARSFEQFSDGQWMGWRASTQGYLSEQALVTATAMFVVLHGHDETEICAELKPYLKKDFRKAMKAVRYRYADMEAAMSEVDLSDWTFN